MTDRDIDELFRRFADLDSELKSLKQEVGSIKQIQQNGVGGNFAKGCTLPTTPFIDKPIRYPNESLKDYIKRIREYNEAQVYEDDTK